MRATILVLAVLAAFTTGAMMMPAADTAKPKKVYQLRTYYAAEGKMAALHTRFRDHTVKLFKKHGIEVVGFWKPRDAKQADDVFWYIVAFPSQEAGEKAWAAFRADPEWIKAKADSEVGGSLTRKVESVYVDATDYSPLP